MAFRRIFFTRLRRHLCRIGAGQDGGDLLRRRLDSAFEGRPDHSRASILQLLLGNIGRPGGGILALRGHASIQGSTDIPTLYDILPGYLAMPRGGKTRRFKSISKRTRRRLGSGRITRSTLSVLESLLREKRDRCKTTSATIGFRKLPATIRSSNTSTTCSMKKWKACF